MGEPVGKGSGRTFSARSTYVPAPCWSSLWVMSSPSPKMSIRPPSEALKSGLPMAVFATGGFSYIRFCFTLSPNSPLRTILSIFYSPSSFNTSLLIVPSTPLNPGISGARSLSINSISPPPLTPRFNSIALLTCLCSQTSTSLI
jgi:hypothetical protein